MSAADLHAKLDRVQIIDTRPAAQFAGGRIPRAIYLDLWALSLNDTDPAPMHAFFWSISHYLTAHGIDPKRPVVVYEAEEVGPRAARVFWFLEFFGHPDVRVLDGGFKAWTNAGLPVEAGEARALNSGSWPDDNSTPRREEVLAGWRDVFAAAGAPAPRTDVAILDTRSEGEYRGTTVRATRGGAIPNAIHVEWKDNLREDGTFKSADELRRMYESKGVTPDREVISYCQGGYRAAHAYIALRLLGYPRVRNYVSSYGEWGNREDLPVIQP
jgi:thiosulfate/3-mercaptopyruvate sulfurtransferase